MSISGYSYSSFVVTLVGLAGFVGYLTSSTIYLTGEVGVVISLIIYRDPSSITLNMVGHTSLGFYNLVSK